MKGTPVLTDRVCNYNFYFTILNQSYLTSEGYTIPLRPREIALLNSTIVSTQPHTSIGLLSQTTFSFDEVYSRGLGRPFACFKLQIPRTGFKDIFGDDYLAQLEKIKLPNTKIKLLQKLLAKANYSCM